MRFFTFLLLLISISSQAQPPCSAPGMTPETGISVCTVLSFPQANVPSCTGPNLPFGGCADPVTTSNSVWYRFHCYQTGTLGFLISPLSGLDDYDWQLMDITGHLPQDVLTTNLAVSINLSGVTGSTGCTAAGTTNVNCAGGANGTQFNRRPTLFAGNDYLLMVTNWSASGLGYNLIFTGGTAALTDNLLPTINNVSIVGCNSSLLKVQFSEGILCNSLTTTGSEFTITNGTHVITGITSVCSGGSNAMNELTLSLQNPLSPGNYQLIVNDGTDGNTFLDVCESLMPAATTIPFTVPVQIPFTISNVLYAGCAPTILKLPLSKPVLCNSITASGSEFAITPGNPAIAAVLSSCTSGGLYTDTFQIVLQNPLPHGSYQVTLKNGGDGNTLVDTCGFALPVGYNIPFVITQTTIAPVIQSVGFNECSPSTVIVNFDKPVACNSLSANGSEFSITPGTLSVAGISSNCVANGFTSQVTLNLSGNLPAGNFNVNINNGSDGNTLSDSCFSFIPVNATRPFITTKAPTPVYDSLQYNLCSPSVIKVYYSKAIRCSSVNPNGSEFSITGPAAVSIVSVATDATCSNGYTNWLLLQLSQPINTFGSYLLHNIAGTDGNSVIDTCSMVQDITETISFNVLGTPSAAFTGQINFGCVMDTILVSHPGGNGINSWTWNFSDGTTATGQTALHTFPVSTVTASVQLIVNNGQCSDTLLKSFTLDNAFNSGFTISGDTTCMDIAVNFTNTSTGSNLQYVWAFGDNTQFVGQTPPAHSYTVSNTYTIQLIATNNYACKDTAYKNIFVAALPLVSFTGLNPQYCTGENVRLFSQLQGNITSYTWNNGNGLTFQNQPTINFNYNSQGNFTISLDATDKFCGVVTSNAGTNVFQIPLFNLGPDIVLCPGITTQIGVEPSAGYTYLWNTGATTSTIITVPQSSNYRLTADNNGCKGEDAIFVRVMDNCLIKVPGAFTPNNDGLNDQLKAINAELATNFSLKVYNRYGQLVFSTINPVSGWAGIYKGAAAETGTYVWILNYTDPVSHKAVSEKGTSILIR